MTLSINTSRHCGVVLMRLQGEITRTTATRLRTEISLAVFSTPRPSRLVVDLSDVTATDATGLGSMVVANRICRHLGVQLDVRQPAVVLKPLLGVGPGPAPPHVT